MMVLSLSPFVSYHNRTLNHHHTLDDGYNTHRHHTSELKDEDNEYRSIEPILQR
jgi:hypothetical protein